MQTERLTDRKINKKRERERERVDKKGNGSNREGCIQLIHPIKVLIFVS